MGEPVEGRKLAIHISGCPNSAMYAEGYGDWDRVVRLFRDLRAAAREPACSRCSQCMVSCPNGLVVRDRIGAAMWPLG